jgi:hypothetical protein
MTQTPWMKKKPLKKGFLVFMFRVEQYLFIIVLKLFLWFYFAFYIILYFILF